MVFPSILSGSVADRGYFHDTRAPTIRVRQVSIRGLDTESALELLAILNVAERLDDISPPKSGGLHPLKGNRRGQWAITANGPWRICFRFKGGDAYEVEIVDYY